MCTKLCWSMTFVWSGERGYNETAESMATRMAKRKNKKKRKEN